MVSDRRAVRWLLVGSGAAALLFFLGVYFAPEEERAFRTNPHQRPLLAGELLSESPESQLKAVVYMEGRAALSGDVEGAMRLWAPDGVVRDANYTPDDSTDDKTWSGLDAVRARYRDEFRERRYLRLSHTDASVVIDEERAVVVNDLRAEVVSKVGLQRIFLSKGDRWTFRKDNGGWKIVELVVNRSPR
jgi:hypothetical protein